MHQLLASLRRSTFLYLDPGMVVTGLAEPVLHQLCETGARARLSTIHAVHVTGATE